MITEKDTINILIKVKRKLAYLTAATIGRQKLRLAGAKFGEGLVLYGVPVVSIA